MKHARGKRLGSTIALALDVLAPVWVAHMVGRRRIGRVAALATEGYLTRARRSRSRQ
jgi:hypothetical protein